MQPNCVLAFRKRLSNLGYTNISIKRVASPDGIYYFVSACEPLCHQVVSSLFPISAFPHLAR